MTKVNNNLTRREQFIMAAMQGILSNKKYSPLTLEDKTKAAVNVADATIAHMDATALEHSPLEKEMD